MVLTLVASASVVLGRCTVGVKELASLWGAGGAAASGERLYHILTEVRLPRVVGAMLVGAGLSASGATLQGVFVNPLVSPGLLGAVSGASFGAALAIMISGDVWLIQLFAFAFGLLAVLLVVLLAAGRGRLSLVLGGMVSGAMFQSLLSLLKVIANPFQELPAIVHWTVGNLALADRHTLTLVAPLLVGCILALCCSGRTLNVLSLGDDEAASLGLRVGPCRTLLVALATLTSSLCVVLAGGLGWVGLVVPHLARHWVGANHRTLLPGAALIGATYLLVVDDAARLVFATEVPTGLMTAFIGLPFLASLVRSGRGEPW